MFTHEERERAINLYLQYDCSPSAVIRELGYPSRNILRKWYKEYLKAGYVVEPKRHSKFTAEQRTRAVEYYLEHGRSVSRTVKALGYPGKTTLCEWLDQDVPKDKRRWHCKANGGLIRCTQEQKIQAVVAYCSGVKSPTEISKELGVSPNAVYGWKKKFLSKECHLKMSQKNIGQPVIAESEIQSLREEKEALEQQLKSLREENYRLQLQNDILEKAGEILKKGQGISLERLTNLEKAEVIDALRNNYRLKDLLQALKISKSSYCYQENRIHRPDKYGFIRDEIRIAFSTTAGCYGYRRIHAILKRGGISVSEKVVRRLMKEEGLSVHCVKRKKYNSYAGEISPEVENIVNRDFHAEKPNMKWLTDISEFSIPAGKIYLSPIIDCFDGLAVAWSIGTSPDAELVNSMLDEAISSLKEGEYPIVHSDRGSHYRWPGWIDRMNEAGLTRSMSKKGCSPDNSACEGFFGRLKNEMFYGKSWRDTSIEEFIARLDNYIHWYNNERIKESLGWRSPLEYRYSLGITG